MTQASILALVMLPEYLIGTRTLIQKHRKKKKNENAEVQEDLLEISGTYIHIIK